MYNPIFLFLNIGGQEMIFIFIIALFFFGGKKLPELARGLGRGIREFKDASENIKRDISDQINDFEKDLNTDKVSKSKELPEATSDTATNSNSSQGYDDPYNDPYDSLVNNDDSAGSDAYYRQFDYEATEETGSGEQISSETTDTDGISSAVDQPVENQNQDKELNSK